MYTIVGNFISVLFFGGISIGIILCFIRRLYVKPIMDAINAYYSSSCGLTMYFVRVRAKANYSYNEYLRLKEEKELLEVVKKRILNVERPVAMHFMTNEEREKYESFNQKYEKNPILLENAKRDYEKYGKK